MGSAAMTLKGECDSTCPYQAGAGGELPTQTQDSLQVEEGLPQLLTASLGFLRLEVRERPASAEPLLKLLSVCMCVSDIE